jgi:hypothetical protein
VSYGLPTGTRITYGSAGFPPWVYQLADHFGLKASTYPGHQESHRHEAGFAPNPNRQNRGIDWSGPVVNMQRFADYLMTVKSALEQVIWQNPNTGQKAGVAGGKDVTVTGYYASDYAGHRDHVHTRQSAPIPLPGGTSVPDNRPAYNEFALWTNNCSNRGSTKVDTFLVHTQEGGGGNSAAEDLAKYCRSTEGTSNPVSYHYYLSQASDGGVTVVDGVDTDLYSYSVLSANRRSINLCFAGSRAAWSRTDWLTKAGNAIDVAAYLAVQDAKKYSFPTNVIAPPYTGRIPGISDHRYVTKVLGDGTHTDVGDGFPWDVFTAAVAKYSGAGAPSPTPVPAKRFPDDWTDRELMVEILRQLRGPTLNGWPQLGGKSLVDAVAALSKDA